MAKGKKKKQEWLGELIEDAYGQLRIKNPGKYGSDMLGKVVKGLSLGRITVQLSSDGGVPIHRFLPEGANAYLVTDYRDRVIAQSWDSFLGESNTYYTGTATIEFYQI